MLKDEVLNLIDIINAKARGNIEHNGGGDYDLRHQLLNIGRSLENVAKYLQDNLPNDRETVCEYIKRIYPQLDACKSNGWDPYDGAESGIRGGKQMLLSLLKIGYYGESIIFNLMEKKVEFYTIIDCVNLFYIKNNNENNFIQVDDFLRKASEYSFVNIGRYIMGAEDKIEIQEKNLSVSNVIPVSSIIEFNKDMVLNWKESLGDCLYAIYL